MHRYIRVVSDSPHTDLNDVIAAVTTLIETNSAVSIIRPPAHHPRGGYSLFLDFPDIEVESVIQYLVDRGWRPCI